eukprot:scaffold21792_cov13-Tisochrysis_lutea.AAC.1
MVGCALSNSSSSYCCKAWSTHQHQHQYSQQHTSSITCVTPTSEQSSSNPLQYSSNSCKANL